MGRGRSGDTVSSRRKCARGNQSHVFFTQNGPYQEVHGLTRKQLEALKRIPNEQLAAVILSPAAQPSAPHEQTLSSGHQEGSTPRASQAS